MTFEESLDAWLAEVRRRSYRRVPEELLREAFAAGLAAYHDRGGKS